MEAILKSEAAVALAETLKGLTVKEFFKGVGAKIAASAAKIWAAITTASLASLLKFGAIIGAGIAVIVLIVKFIRMKRQQFSDENNKTVTDRALQLNYADVRNQKELHPTMKKVKKEMKKELKPREKKGKKKKGSNPVKTTNPYFRKFESFEKKYNDSKKDDEGNTINLRNIWDLEFEG